MFGMKPPRANLPQILLTAGVLRGNILYRKLLPLHAINAPIHVIFTPDNLKVILTCPDKMVRQFPKIRETL
jgi:hypothetical protein